MRRESSNSSGKPSQLHYSKEEGPSRLHRHNRDPPPHVAHQFEIESSSLSPILPGPSNALATNDERACPGIFSDVGKDVFSGTPILVRGWGISSPILKLTPVSCCLAILRVLVLGNLLSHKTKKIGILETLLATAISGATFSAFSKQPIVVIGVDGPVVIFLIAAHDAANRITVDFPSWLGWIGLWCSGILILLASANACRLTSLLTSFGWEILRAFTGLAFFWESMVLIIGLFDKPNSESGAMFSLWLATGTLIISLLLSGAQSWMCCGGQIREFFASSSPIIALILFSVLQCIHQFSKQNIPHADMSLSNHSVGSAKPLSFVRLSSVPSWAIILAALPGSLLAVLIFIDYNATALLLQKSIEIKHDSGTRSWDLLLLAALILFCALLGLPYVYGLFYPSKHILERIPKQVVVEDEELQQEARLEMHGWRTACILSYFLLPFALIGGIRKVLSFIPHGVLTGLLVQMAWESISSLNMTKRLQQWVVDSSEKIEESASMEQTPTWVTKNFTLVQLMGTITIFATALSPVGLAYPLIFILLVVFCGLCFSSIYGHENTLRLDPKLVQSNVNILSVDCDGSNNNSLIAPQFPPLRSESSLSESVISKEIASISDPPHHQKQQRQQHQQHQQQEYLNAGVKEIMPIHDSFSDSMDFNKATDSRFNSGGRSLLAHARGFANPPWGIDLTRSAAQAGYMNEGIKTVKTNRKLRLRKMHGERSKMRRYSKNIIFQNFQDDRLHNIQYTRGKNKKTFKNMTNQDLFLDKVPSNQLNPDTSSKESPEFEEISSSCEGENGYNRKDSEDDNRTFIYSNSLYSPDNRSPLHHKDVETHGFISIESSHLFGNDSEAIIASDGVRPIVGDVRGWEDKDLNKWVEESWKNLEKNIENNNKYSEETKSAPQPFGQVFSDETSVPEELNFSKLQIRRKRTNWTDNGGGDDNSLGVSKIRFQTNNHEAPSSMNSMKNGNAVILDGKMPPKDLTSSLLFDDPHNANTVVNDPGVMNVGDGVNDPNNLKIIDYANGMNDPPDEVAATKPKHETSSTSKEAASVQEKNILTVSSIIKRLRFNDRDIPSESNSTVDQIEAKIDCNEIDSNNEVRFSEKGIAECTTAEITPIQQLKHNNRKKEQKAIGRARENGERFCSIGTAANSKKDFVEVKSFPTDDGNLLGRQKDARRDAKLPGNSTIYTESREILGTGGTSKSRRPKLRR